MSRDSRHAGAGEPGATSGSRLAVPVRVELAGRVFTVDVISASLIDDGLVLPAASGLEPGTRGRLTFRPSRWDEPFTVDGEVVRSESPDGQATPGVRVCLAKLTPEQDHRLRRMVAGAHDGSVTHAIRRAVRHGEAGHRLRDELRRRPVDQKMMFASSASGEEIEALIRDGQPDVVLRLLRNPRLTAVHVRAILRDTGLPSRVLSAVARHRRWLAGEPLRVLFCAHPSAPLQDVLPLLERLSPGSLKTLARKKDLRASLALRVRELVRRRPPAPAG